VSLPLLVPPLLVAPVLVAPVLVAPVLPSERQNTLRGIGLTLISAVLFANTNAAAKWVMTGIPTGELLWIRAVVALGVVSFFIPRYEWARLWTGGQLHLHALRNICSAIEILCFYWAISKTPMADMTTIYLASPIYVTALAAVFLHEKVGWRRWSAVLVGFVGVLVAMQPSGESVSAPVLIAVGGSMLYAISLVATRRLRGTPSTVLVATQMITLILLSSATATVGWMMPSLLQVAVMVAIGVVSLVAFWTVNEGLHLAPASVVAPFNYTSIIWATLLGFLVFGDIPATTTLSGAGIIVGAGLFIMMRERRVAVPPPL
jgi:drug/metabolite transporter (DMT)-like permease